MAKKRHFASNSKNIANLPQDLMIKFYPSAGLPAGEGLDDTITEIDRQIKADSRRNRSHTKFPEKY